MGKSGALGSFEELVMLAILHGADDAYAVSIHRELSARTGTDVAIGAIYATLDRLTDKGLVRSDVERPSGAIGRPRRVYRVLPTGIEALATTRRIRSAMWDGVQLDAPTESAS